MTRKYEQTDVGAQTLIDGVRSVTLGDRLNVMTRLPIMPKRNPNVQQKPCDISLFDGEVGKDPVNLFRSNGRAQIDLIDFITELETSK